MEFKTLMLNYLTATLGKSNEEVTDLLFKKSDDGTPTDEISETALESLEAIHAEHLTAAPSDLLKAEFNKGHQAGKFEALSKEEESLRKAYSLEGKGKLKDLVAEAISRAAKDGMSEDKILTHPLFVKVKTDAEEQIEALRTEMESRVSEATTKADRQLRFSQVTPTIDTALQAAGVSADFLKPAAKRAFLSQFEGKDFEVLETGVFIKNADGSLEKDKHGHPIKLEAFVAKTAADWFPIEKQPGRTSPGNDPVDAPPTKWTKDNLPKTTADFETAYYNTTDPAERTALTQAFQEANQGA
jgi:hypothetical protein